LKCRWHRNAFNLTWGSLGDKGGHTSVWGGGAQHGKQHNKKKGYAIEDVPPPLASVTISVTVTPLLPHTQCN